MKVPAKILMVLVLLLSFAYVFRVVPTHAAYVYWEDRLNAEKLQVGTDLTLLNTAYDEYFARRQQAMNVGKGEMQNRISELQATRRGLSAHYQDAQSAATEAQEAYVSLERVISQQLSILPKSYQELVGYLRESTSTRRRSYSDLLQSNQEDMKNLYSLYGEAGRKREAMLKLEFAQYMLQEELRLREELLYKYRYLEPGIQRKLGDNGSMGIQGTVTGVSPAGIDLNVGQRDGVQLYQKYGVYRNGDLVAIVNVISRQNASAQAEVTTTVKDGGPRNGDLVQPLRY